MHDDSGWYGCCHDEKEDGDDDVRWTYVHVENDHYYNDSINTSDHGIYINF